MMNNYSDLSKPCKEICFIYYENIYFKQLIHRNGLYIYSAYSHLLVNGTQSDSREPLNKSMFSRDLGNQI